MTTKKTTKKQSNISNVEKVGIGVGLTAAAVAAAGAYFLYGSKDASKNRKKVKSWALKAKAEVLETLENAEHITEAEFASLVNGVSKTYSKVNKISKNELNDFKKEMADNWQDLLKSGVAKMTTAQHVAKKLTQKKPTKKTTKTAVKKTVKKAAKKASKKTTKK